MSIHRGRRCHHGRRRHSEETALPFQLLDYVVTDRIAEITMRRAPVNALNHALVEEINAAYRTALDERRCGPSS